MKQKNQKHGKENLIGKIIYGFLMFMPLLAILTTCAYVIFNKNAYQSFDNSNDTGITQVVVDDSSDFNTNTRYYLTNVYANNNTGNIGNSENRIYINNFNVIYNYSQYDLTNTIAIGFYQNAGGTNIGFYFYYDNTHNYNLTSSTGFKVSFNYLSSNLPANNITQNSNAIYYESYNTISLDNAFYYSIDKLEQNPIFSWSSNTGTYTVLENTCQTLGISATFIPMLLSYWLMMSLMYLLYDIALLIVHMAHNRIHDIESSI